MENIAGSGYARGAAGTINVLLALMLAHAVVLAGLHHRLSASMRRLKRRALRRALITHRRIETTVAPLAGRLTHAAHGYVYGHFHMNVALRPSMHWWYGHRLARIAGGLVKE